MADEYGEYGSWCTSIDLDRPATTTTITIPSKKIYIVPDPPPRLRPSSNGVRPATTTTITIPSKKIYIVPDPPPRLRPSSNGVRPVTTTTITIPSKNIYTIPDRNDGYGVWTWGVQQRQQKPNTVNTPLPSCGSDGKSSVLMGLQQQQQQQQQHTAKVIRNPYQKKRKAPTLIPPPLGALSVSLLVECLGYLDPESLRIAYLLSRQIRHVINNYNELKLIRLLQISPAGNKDDEGRFERLLEQMHKRRDQLQRYREIKIIGFNNSWVIHDREAKNRIVKKLRESNFKLKGVVSMNFLSPSPSYNQSSAFLVTVLATAFPNLREVNLSNTNATGRALKTLSTTCSRLVKITHNNIQIFLNIAIDGGNMIRAKNLKELYMDNSVFKDTQSSVDRMSNLDDNDNLKNQILFYKCSSKVLERVSIKNAHCFNGDNYRTTPLSQKALIKFVRNAPPSLRWFRSSLTDANTNMLRSERPEIELVN